MNRERPARVLLATALAMLTFVAGSGAARGETEPAANRYVKASYYTEKSPTRNPPKHHVLFVEIGAETESIGRFRYGLLVDQPDKIERFSLAYFAKPGEGICPEGQTLNVSGSRLSEEDREAGYYGATGGKLSLSPRRSVYVRIYSKEPLELVDSFVEPIDGAGEAESPMFEIVDGEGCVKGTFTYEPYHGD